MLWPKFDVRRFSFLIRMLVGRLEPRGSALLGQFTWRGTPVFMKTVLMCCSNILNAPVEILDLQMLGLNDTQYRGISGSCLSN